MNYKSTKILNLGSCAFRQPNAAYNRQDAGNNSQRCSKLHGYRLKAKFWFGCSELDDKNWVQDFGGFGPIKELFANQFDHTTCLSYDDPLLPLFKELDSKGGLDLRIMPEGTGIEKIAKFCYDNMQNFVNGQSNGRVWVEKVEVFEHEDNSALYIPTVTKEDIESVSTCCGGEETPYQVNTKQEVVQETIKEEAPQPVQGPVTYVHRPGVSEGMSNPFAGTKWGM